MKKNLCVILVFLGVVCFAAARGIAEKAIEENEKAGNLTHEDTYVLIGLLERLYMHLYGDVEIFKKEGVNDVISEKLILDIDRVIYDSDMKIQKAEEKLRKAEEKSRKAEEKSKKAEENRAVEIAQNMLNAGMTVEQVKELTKLPLSKIKKLQPVK